MLIADAKVARQVNNISARALIRNNQRTALCLFENSLIKYIIGLLRMNGIFNR